MAYLESARLIHHQVKSMFVNSFKQAEENRAEEESRDREQKQAASVYVYIVWRANWRMVTYLRDGEDSRPGVWRRALCV